MLGFIRKVRECPVKRLKRKRQVTSPRQKQKKADVLKRNIYLNKKIPRANTSIREERKTSSSQSQQIILIHISPWILM